MPDPENQVTALRDEIRRAGESTKALRQWVGGLLGCAVLGVASGYRALRAGQLSRRVNRLPDSERRAVLDELQPETVDGQRIVKRLREMERSRPTEMTPTGKSEGAESEIIGV